MAFSSAFNFSELPDAIGALCPVRQTEAMTLTLELKPEVENLLRAVAKERGVSLEEVVASRLDFSEESLEELEDELDIAAIRRARLESDPNERYTLDDLRAAMAERRK